MKPNYNTYLKTFATLGCLAVVLGAFGAHFLKEKLSSTALSAYQTGIQYQFYHTLAGLFAVLWLKKELNNKLIWSIRSFIIGIFLFSGSLYLLAIKDWLELPFLGIAGPITPIGGLAFIMGWVFFFLSINSHKP